MVAQPRQRDDAEKFAVAHVVPVENRPQRAVVAVLRVAQHPPDEPHVGELREALRGAVAFVKHVLGFDVEPELLRGVYAFGDGRVKAVQAVQQ